MAKQAESRFYHSAFLLSLLIKNSLFCSFSEILRNFAQQNFFFRAALAVPPGPLLSCDLTLFISLIALAENGKRDDDVKSKRSE